MASSSTTSLSGIFKFVLIPEDETKPIQQIEESKEGGLTNDKLIQHARTYYGPSAICDIAALTIPTPTNDYTAISMYHHSDGSTSPNKRAMALIVGCGLAAMTIQGDVFVGRCKDNEMTDVWERMDFTIADADPSSQWCQVARRNSASKGTKQQQASSLSGILQQQIGNSNVLQSPAAETTNNFGTNGEFVKEDWGAWCQTNEEVELKFVVSESTKGKDVKVKFGRTNLVVTVSGVEVLKGATFDPVIADECTYTIQTEQGGTRELCVTLAKENDGTTWSYAVK